MNLQDLKSQCIKEQKKGIHFIMASVVIWTLISIIQLSAFEQLTKNLFTFMATSLLVPISYGLSRLLGITFSNKKNPLNQLGFLFSLNQFLYLLIAMWVYAAMPEKFIMVMAIIFGAHLLPFGWLYDSKTYTAMALLISLGSFVGGFFLAPGYHALIMVAVEVIFVSLLWTEVNKGSSKRQKATS